MLSFVFLDRYLNWLHWLSINASNKRRNVEKDCGVYLGAVFIRGRRLMIILLVPAAFNRGRRSFEGGVYSNNYGICRPKSVVVPSRKVDCQGLAGMCERPPSTSSSSSLLCNLHTDILGITVSCVNVLFILVHFRNFRQGQVDFFCRYLKLSLTKSFRASRGPWLSRSWRFVLCLTADSYAKA